VDTREPRLQMATDGTPSEAQVCTYCGIVIESPLLVGKHFEDGVVACHGCAYFGGKPNRAERRAYAKSLVRRECDG